jgi:hypothetical protein
VEENDLLYDIEKNIVQHSGNNYVYEKFIENLKQGNDQVKEKLKDTLILWK